MCPTPAAAYPCPPFRLTPECRREHISPFQPQLDNSFSTNPLLARGKPAVKRPDPLEAYAPIRKSWLRSSGGQAFQGTAKREKLRRFHSAVSDMTVRQPQLNDTDTPPNVPSRYLGLLYVEEASKGCRSVSAGVNRLSCGESEAGPHPWDGAPKSGRPSPPRPCMLAEALTPRTSSRNWPRGPPVPVRAAGFDDVPLPWAGLPRRGPRVVNGIVVSTPAYARVRGAQHEETLYSGVKTGPLEARASSPQTAAQCLQDRGAAIVDPVIRAFQERLEELGRANRQGLRRQKICPGGLLARAGQSPSQGADLQAIKAFAIGSGPTRRQVFSKSPTTTWWLGGP
jgi:hypothetical protein